MRVARYSLEGQTPRLGIVTDAGCIDLATLGFDFARFADLWDAGAAAHSQIAAAAEAAAPEAFHRDVVWHAPLDSGSTFWAAAANYSEHLKEGNFPRPDYPPFFIRTETSLVGHGGDVLKPWFSDRLDYEGELTIVIGKEARFVAESDAMDYIAGYTCFNDGSVRDWQRHTNQITLGKNFAGSGALGPWVTTADVIDDIDSKELRTVVNGRVVQRSAVGEAIYGVAYVVSYLSAATVLRPGDMIALGTPGGVGARQTPPLFLQEGDTVEITIDGVGTLSHGVKELISTGAKAPAGVESA